MEFLDIQQELQWDDIDNTHQIRVIQFSPVTQKRLALSQIKSAVEVSASTSSSEITLVNNWVNYDSGIFGDIRLWKHGMFIFCTGVIKNGTAPANVATIDDSTFWPLHTRILSVDTDGGAKRLDIKPDGSIRYFGINTAFVSLCFSYTIQ